METLAPTLGSETQPGATPGSLRTGSPEKAPPPAAGPPAAGKGLPFALEVVLLLASLATEMVFNFLSLILFVFRRRAHRERVRKIIFHGTYAEMLRKSAASPVARGALVLLLAIALGGCSATNPKVRGVNEGKGVPGSFQRQVYETRWSFQALANQSDSRKSLEDDLISLGSDPDWKEELRFSAEALFLAPDARKSLEDDLKALGDPDHKQHGLMETLRMSGW